MKKLLVWDGDETLWSGTLLEGDRPVLPEGRAALCAELCERGVLQSIASTNLLSDVKVTLHRFDLDRFFLVPQADLERSKPEMVSAVMAALGLAREEDVVFVDDRPENRAEVAAALPGVVVGGPEHLEELLQLFEKPRYTDDDRRRVRRYQAEQVRRQAAASYAGDHIAFLRSIGLELVLAPPSDKDWPRVLDLVERSNRFSAFDRDYPPEALAEARGQMVVGRVSDSFGEYGLSTVLVDDGANIRLLVVSCRLQGKGIGSALVGWTLNRHMGETVQASWRETQYNAGVRALYEWYGFEFGRENGCVHASKHVQERVDLPEWVALR